MQITRDIQSRFRSVLKGIIDRILDAPETHERVAQKVTARVASMQQAGIVPKEHTVAVNGVVGAPLDTVNLRGGSIVYRFESMGAVVRAGMEEVFRRSPVRSGDYVSAWFVVVDGQPWNKSFDEIPSDSTVLITNFAPYARHVEEGWEVRRRARGGSYATARPTSGKTFQGARSRHLVVELAKAALIDRFPNMVIGRVYVALPNIGSVRGWQVPYIRRTGQEQGQQILYPAIQITRGLKG